MSNEFILPVYVISLLRHTDRRTSIAEHLKSLGVPFEFIDAVDGKSLSAEILDKYVAPENRSMPVGHTGCYLSHLAAFQRMVERNQPQALILEDDARISRTAAEKLSTISKEDPDFDYCYLDWETPNREGPIAFDPSSKIRVANGLFAKKLSAAPLTTHAYLISRNAAMRRIEHAFPIRHPIDVFSDLPYSSKFTAVISPRLAWLSSFANESSTFETKAPRPKAVLFAKLKRSHLYFYFRDLLKGDVKRARKLIKSEVQANRLAKEVNWQPLPSGKHVLYR